MFAPPSQDDLDAQVEAILEQMSIEERVGQLFVVTYFGSEITPGSEIARLITDYHIGGVVIQPVNNNLVEPEEQARHLLNTTTLLQSLAAGVGAENPDAQGRDAGAPSRLFIPLFIGIEYNGLSWPTRLIADASPLPSAMAIGATWDPTLAEAAGEAAGREMELLGLNMLLGPTADVVENPQPFTTGDQGNLVFGGEPFWVSQMTSAYVRGVHIGSGSRVAVFPRHFPGYGAADRLASVEVPTVRRTLDQLTQFDLQPFFAVTGGTDDAATLADGLMTGHIRYLGFQGDNPRQATRPISLDPLALQVLMSIEPIASWRSGGGLLITDALGQRGVVRFYDPRELTVRNRRIAQDALLAGNDLLFLGNFGTVPEDNQDTTIRDTIDFFTQAYTEDPTFQQRVDDAVRRILRKKLELYGQFTLDAVLPDPEGVEALGAYGDISLQTARRSLTLLSPDQVDLLSSPQAGDDIVVFTDVRTYRPCEACAERPIVAVDALQSAILRLYGPQASGLVGFADINSFTFEQLDSYLRFGSPTGTPDATAVPDPLAIALADADWVVFVMLGVNPDVPASMAVKQFLADPPVDADAQLVVMAMNAPYYLDSTEISKLAAFYALYNSTPPFIDLAARALFQQAPISGASPVSVAGIRYDILSATSPDPAQVIKLSYTFGVLEASSDVTATPDISGQRGDTLTVSTSVILDRNGHPVPDGTPVELVLNYLSAGLRDTIALETVGGTVQASVLLDRPGSLEITAASPPATNSTTIRLTVPDTGEAIVDVVDPEITPAASPQPTITPLPQQLIPEATPTPEPEQGEPAGQPSVEFADLFLSLLGMVIAGLIIFAFFFARQDLNAGLLHALPTIVVGLIAYNYYALLLPGAGLLYGLLGETWAAPAASWAGSLLGLGIVRLGLYVWDRWAVQTSRSRNKRREEGR